jgi:hypothetical protein
MKEGRKSYLLRINEELWDNLNKWADQEFRSVNGQIELILQRAVEEWKKGRKKKKTRGTSEDLSGDKELKDLIDV